MFYRILIKVLKYFEKILEEEMNKKLKVLLTFFTVGMMIILTGCSTKEGVYQRGEEEFRISDNQIEHQKEVTSLSYLTESHSIKEKEKGQYVTDTSKGLIWEYTIHKDDPLYDELMEELDYFVEKGFEVEDTESATIATGEGNEDLLGELGVTFNEKYNEFEFTDTGIILNDEEYVEVE